MKVLRMRCRKLAVVTVLLAAASTGLQAAPPAPAVTGTAHARLWKTDLRALPAWRVALQPDGSHATSHDLGTGGPGYFFGEYIDLPAGRGTFGVFADKDKHPLDGLPVNLKPGEFVTVLLTEPAKAGEPPRIELIDDGGAEPAALAQITVRNFVTDLKDVRVAFGETLDARFAPGVGLLLMRGILPAVYEVHTSGTNPGGEPFQWTNEIDFRQSRRLTLLIYPDPYGRIRPRISVDGETSSKAPEKQDGQR